MKEPEISEAQRAMADEVVLKQLKLGEFFAAHSNDIFDRLEECEKSAIAAETAPNIDFFAEAFPIIGSVIHVGSKRHDYGDALVWARGKFPKGEPASVPHCSHIPPYCPEGV